MKIYTRIEFDSMTGAVLHAESFDYDGPLALCTGAEEAAPAAAEAAKGAGEAAAGAGITDASLGELGINTALGADALATGIPAAAFGPEAGNVVYGVAGAPTGTELATGIPALAEGTITNAPINEGAARGAAPSEASLGELGINTALPAGTAGAPATTGFVPSAPPAPPPTPVTGTSPTASGLPVGGGVPAEQLPAPVETAVKKPVQSGISKALDSLGITKAGKLGPNALPLALNLGSAALQSGSRNTLQKQLQKIAQPASDASKQLLGEGLSGQVPAAVMQQFDQSYKDKVGEITQRYANMGRDASTDSAAQAEIQRAKDARDAQVANYSASLTSQGLSAAGVAAGPATAAATAAAQQDQALQQAMSGSLQQMALLEALSRNTQGAPAP